ncbi:MAG TPA: M28 family peptidase [Gemmatimonadaceae bacterium]|nr:M28 family peptidase [Gemmatimonadaceae bacterium]
MHIFRVLIVCALPALSACSVRVTPSGVPTQPDSAIIRRHIEFLANDRLEGRGTGSAGNDSAAAYIAKRFRELQLSPQFPGYFQKFEARAAQDAHLGRTAPRPTQNVVGLLPGSDPNLRNEYIVIGAHFDHLGRSSASALDPAANDAIRNGADDNASGTAAVLELARLLAAHPLKRSVIFVAFSGEELGLLGSQWFVENPPVPTDRIVAMLNFDMVGRLRNDKLFVYGTGTASELQSLVDSANVASGAPFRITSGGDGFGSSDHSSFYVKDIPVLHFFTDLHEDYHRATDDSDKVSAAGAARVVGLALKLTRDIGNRSSRLTFTRSAAPRQVASTRSGSDTYLGSIPDMSAADTPGLRLTGIRAGSPADSAGLKSGDVIVEFAGKPVKDLYTYSDALYAQKPGDVVKIVVLRDTKRVEFTVKLGKRGG